MAGGRRKLRRAKTKEAPQTAHRVLASDIGPSSWLWTLLFPSSESKDKEKMGQQSESVGLGLDTYLPMYSEFPPSMNSVEDSIGDSLGRGSSLSLPNSAMQSWQPNDSNGRPSNHTATMSTSEPDRPPHTIGPTSERLPTVCHRCGKTFPSRNKVMRHLFPASPSASSCDGAQPTTATPPSQTDPSPPSSCTGPLEPTPPGSVESELQPLPQPLPQPASDQLNNASTPSHPPDPPHPEPRLSDAQLLQMKAELQGLLSRVDELLEKRGLSTPKAGNLPAAPSYSPSPPSFIHRFRATLNRRSSTSSSSSSSDDDEGCPITTGSGSSGSAAKRREETGTPLDQPVISTSSSASGRLDSTARRREETMSPLDGRFPEEDSDWTVPHLIHSRLGTPRRNRRRERS